MLPALVLTAGIGSRLDPLTRLVAKPAVPVAGRTLVERVIEWLRHQRVTNLVLNLHHRPETITGVIGDGAHLGVRVRYSWEQPLLGSAGGPRRALPLLGADTFLIVNGDTLCDFEIAPVVARHHETGADVTMALVPNHAPDRYNSVVVDDDFRVRGFVPKGARGPASSAWHFVGAQVVRASLFAPLTDGVPAETVSALYKEGLSAHTLKVYACEVGASFVDVGTPADYLAAAVQMCDAPRGRVVEAGADVDGSATLQTTVVWPGARVGANAELTECIVAGHVDVPAGLRANRAVLVPADLARETDRAEVRGGVAIFPLT